MRLLLAYFGRSREAVPIDAIANVLESAGHAPLELWFRGSRVRVAHEPGILRQDVREPKDRKISPRRRSRSSKASPSTATNVAIAARTSSVEVGGVEVEVIRKNIKNLHLSVRPPDGRVRVSAPRSVDDEAVRLALVSRLGWIRKKQRMFREGECQPEREVVSGESHYFRGKKYRLEVEERDGPARITVRGECLRMSVRPGTNREGREKVLNDWYRQDVKDEIPALIGQWEPVMGVSVAEWGAKRMKTRWGSCNIRARRIWLNSELAKRPPGCLEYVLVHEMVHLLERGHGAAFKSLMDRFLPAWRLRQADLESYPLARKFW